MTVVFSRFFQREFLEAESGYAAISERLGSDFHERVKETVRAIVKWKEITSDRMVYPVANADRFLT